MSRIFIAFLIVLGAVSMVDAQQRQIHTDATVKPLARYSREWDDDKDVHYWSRQPTGVNFSEVYVFCMNGFLFVSTQNSRKSGSSVVQVFEGNNYPALCE